MMLRPATRIAALAAVYAAMILCVPLEGTAQEEEEEAPAPIPIPPEIPVTFEGRSTFQYWGEKMTLGAETTEVPYAVLENRRFKIALLSRKEAPNLLVLRERVRTVQALRMDAMKSDILVECWPASADSTSPPLWRIETKGYDTDVLDRDRHGGMLRIRGGGCCKDVLPDVYYDILTGTRMFASFGEPLRVEMQTPLLRRFVTLSTRDLPEDPGIEGIERIALLEYGARPACSRYLVFAPSADAYGEGEVVFLRDGKPYAGPKLHAPSGGRGKGPEAVGGFGVRITIQRFSVDADGSRSEAEPITIDIPVEEDQLRVEKMRANPGVRLEPLLGNGG